MNILPTLSNFNLPPTAESKWLEIRQLRDDLLKQTDWTQVLDTNLSDSAKEAYRVYRQALRDLPQNNTNPFSITIPSKP
jgi:hypothetical protein